MQKDLLEKQNELKSILPRNPKFHEWLSNSDIWGWFYSVQKIEGKKPKKSNVVQMLSGEIVQEASILDYQKGEAWKKIYQDAKAEIAMGNELSANLIMRWAKVICSSDKPLRKENGIVVYEWDLIPKDDVSLIDLEVLCKRFNIFKKVCPYIFDAAADLVLGFCRLYPFSEHTTEVMLAILMFCIMEQGFYLPELSVDDREFNQIMARCLEIGGAESFADMVERAVYNRIISIKDLAIATKDNGHERY